MLLRNLLEDLNNAYSIPQAMFVLNDLCIDKNGESDWNFAVNVKGRIENTSIMLRQGTFVTDTFIHKNYDVMFDIKRKNAIMLERPKVNFVALKGFKEMIQLNLN
jgi:hypothetical protein